MDLGPFLRNVLAFIVVLGTLIFLHEAGHFLVAKLLRFPVSIFSIGFGKRLWGFKIRETDYRLSLIPLGGYVRVIGLGPDEAILAEGGEGAEAPPVASRNRGARILVFLAGPVANALTAIVFLAFSYMLGREVPAYLEKPVVVGGILPDSPAASSGLRAGDRIVEIDGKAIATWDQYQMEVMTSGGRELLFRWERSGEPVRHDGRIRVRKSGVADIGETGIYPLFQIRVVRVLPRSPAEVGGVLPGDIILAIAGVPLSPFKEVAAEIAPHEGQPTRFTVERDGKSVDLTVTPKRTGEKVAIGIELRPAYTATQRLGPVPALVESFRQNVDMTVKTLDIIGRLFRARASVKQMSGPLEIARFAGEESRGGLAAFIAFIAMVSLQLFIFNTLPIPLLDGFHIVLVAFEGLIRRDISLAVKERIFQVGFVLLILLMVVVLYFDFVKSLPGLGKLFGG